LLLFIICLSAFPHLGGLAHGVRRWPEPNEPDVFGKGRIPQIAPRDIANYSSKLARPTRPEYRRLRHGVRVRTLLKLVTTRCCLTLMPPVGQRISGVARDLVSSTIRNFGDNFCRAIWIAWACLATREGWAESISQPPASTATMTRIE
jgi:hypothetical protein